MVIGTLMIELHVPASQSLKERRRAVRPTMARLQKLFDVAVADITEQNTWQAATLGVACVSKDERHADEMCQKIRTELDRLSEVVVFSSRFELVHVNR